MLSLRDLQPADAATIATWIGGLDDLILWSGKSGFTWPFAAEQLLALRAADPGRRLMVATDAAGAVIGHFSLRPTGDGAVRLGLVLVAPYARGKGVGAAMVDAALGTAFADPGVSRVTLGVYAHNAVARRLYERFGFQEERVHESSIEVGGTWWTSVTMGLVREAWESGR
ncbi:GNAT family N-acetyltransferase [Nonomuraea sp. NPDC049309]|uniref:GNAT family N-acetyltransferase n=1 Tax=Nonomuraea sp. NPDC049309 TaxID=3364350 RepID=UPI00371D1C53